MVVVMINNENLVLFRQNIVSEMITDGQKKAKQRHSPFCISDVWESVCFAAFLIDLSKWR